MYTHAISIVVAIHLAAAMAADGVNHANANLFVADKVLQALHEQVRAELAVNIPALARQGLGSVTPAQIEARQYVARALQNPRGLVMN